MNVRWIHVMLDLPAAVAEPATRFWATVLGWPIGEPWRGHAEFQSFEPSEGVSYVARQVIESGGPRVHVDIAVDDVQETAAHLQALGAEAGPALERWRVLTSPGGMPFCLVTHREANSMPAPMSWDGGHRSRLVQVCVDSPPALHDDEVAFWKAATHWRWAPSDGPEFAGKLYPRPDDPVQLLFQRLGDSDGGDHTRAHIDLGTDDVDAEVGRLVAAGARRLWDGRDWVAMEDPAGLPFCATANKP
jgi:predicted enzyme related to lactoylglutathione lyase